MEAEKVVRCLKTLKNAPEKMISENTGLLRSKKAERNTARVSEPAAPEEQSRGEIAARATELQARFHR